MESGNYTYSMIVECEPVKQEPEWDESGVSEAAAAEGLYAGHVVKDELTIGPELIQQQDITFGTQNALTIKELNLNMPKPEGGADAAPECARAGPGDAPCCNGSTEQQHTSCSVRFEQFPVLILHMNKPNHNVDANGSTYLCNLSTHKHTHTGENVYSCNICKKQFTQKSVLDRHIQIHTDEKPHRCDVCNKCFRQKCHLISHIQIHTGEKPYNCDVCNKRFTRRNSLIRHVQIHTYEKPYSCDICEKRYTRKSVLARHTRTHTGEKPYRCDICNKRFRQKCHLTSHIQIHTDEKPYNCEECNEGFRRRSRLLTHICRMSPYSNQVKPSSNK